MQHRLFLTNSVHETTADALRTFDEESGRLSASGIARVDEVVDIVRPRLSSLGWRLSSGARSRGGLPLRHPGGSVLCDGYHDESQAALWVETGRSWTNFGFLQHAVEAALCPKVEHVVLAVTQ